VAESIGLVTALSPAIGYENATEVAQEALVSGLGVVEIVERRGLLSRERIDAILSSIAAPAGPRS
jgi:aspartate ammonia-lyase